MSTRILSALVVALVVAVSVQADTLDFTQLSVGPTQSFSLNGVTISSSGEFSIVQGKGLGSGDNGSFDVVKGFGITAPPNPTPIIRDPYTDSFNISVAGRINSMTLQPYFTIDGPAVPDGIPLFFIFTFHPNLVGFGSGQYYRTISYPATGSPYILDVYGNSSCEPACLPEGFTNFGIVDECAGCATRPYEVATNGAPYLMHYGFSITSIDYTLYEPQQVPEPSSLALLPLGLFGIVAAGRYRKRMGEG